MHYCCYVITKDFPTDEIIEKALEPFNEDAFYEKELSDEDRPAFLWDWWMLGGRYCGKFKLKVDRECDPKWKFYREEKPRSTTVFRSRTLDFMHWHCPRQPFDEEHFYGQMGMRDGFLYVDGGPIADMINIDTEAVECFCIVDAEGNGYARERYDGKAWIDNVDFEEQAKRIISESKDCYIAVADIHH